MAREKITELPEPVLNSHVWSTDGASQKIMVTIVKTIPSVRAIAEIGTCVGSTAAEFAQHQVCVFTCDIEDQRAPSVKENEAIHFVLGDSKKLFEKIEEERAFISAVFIDGDHSYDGLKKDFKEVEAYAKRNPGQVEFIFVHDVEGIPDVKRFCDEQLSNPFYNQVRVKTYHPIHGHPNGLAIFQLK